ncbi:MAG: hypothetical protein LBC97_13300 [Bifidobacteriaceae bacterium]|nr:hypothetical protein [Bifidobacteriaceae bacterium]
MNKLCLAAGLAALAILTACGSKESAQPEPTPIGPEEARQAATADQFADCLTQAGVPVSVGTSPDGQKDVEPVGNGELVVISMGGGGGEIGGDYPSEAAWKAARLAAADLVKAHDPYQAAAMSWASEGELEALGGPDPDARYLIIGTTDHTDAFVKCLDQTGYQPSTYAGDPKEILRTHQREAEAAAKWAQCARENGYPGVKDPPAPVLGDRTVPTAVLPASITEADLNALLDRCPNFDMAAQQAFNDAMEALGANPPEDEWQRVWDEYAVVAPSIGFDAPGWDGTDADSGPAPDAATLKHLQSLREVLNARLSWNQESVPAPHAT